MRISCGMCGHDMVMIDLCSTNYLYAIYQCQWEHCPIFKISKCHNTARVDFGKVPNTIINDTNERVE